MDKTTKNVLVFLSKMVSEISNYPGIAYEGKMKRLVNGDFSDFEELPEAMTSWEPVLKAADGVCGTCRHLDREVCFTTYPPKYACSKTGQLHFEHDTCDVPSVMDV